VEGGQSIAYVREGESDGAPTMSEGFQALSEREKETLRLLLGGHDIKSIAADQGLSVHTVNERLRDARRKLGASSSRQAARILADVEQGGANFSGPTFSGDPHFSADKEFGVVGAAVRTSHHEHSDRPPGRGYSLAWLGGGMLIMSLIIAVAVLAFVLEGGGTVLPKASGQMGSTAPAASESVGSARAWLALVDGQQWKESWNAAGAETKSHVSLEQWTSMMPSVASTMGPVTSRALQKVIKATSVPGLPDGQYEILQFDTHFAKKGGAMELMTLAHEGSGWKVDGYRIVPNAVADNQPPTSSSGIAVLEGDWAGQPDAEVGNHRVLLHVHTRNGRTVATLDAPDQYVTGLPATITVDARRVHVTAAGASGAFDGELTGDGTTLKGNWSGNPTTFKRLAPGQTVAGPSRPQTQAGS
jgi:DNA-binding CsgD family transcriptional regulator